MNKKPHKIDIPTENKKDVYYVAKTIKDKKNVIFTTSDFGEAVDVCDQQPEKYHVYNTKEQIMYTNTIKTKKKPYNIHEGLTLAVNGINAYTNPYNTIPDYAYHGVIVIKSDLCKSDKYKVCDKDNEEVEFWCRLKDIENYLL